MSLITVSQRVVRKYTDIVYQTDFLPADYAQRLFQYLLANAKWPKKLQTLGNKRMNVSYGDPNVKYEFTIRRGTSIHTISREVLPWSELPFLQLLRDYVQKATQQTYNYVVIQLYPNKNVGMNPHQDKELCGTRGTGRIATTIAGISLGASRVLTVGNKVTKDVLHFYLFPGSIYLLNPPTNDYNTHCIEKGGILNSSQTSVSNSVYIDRSRDNDSSKEITNLRPEEEIRLSLTFRLMPTVQ